VAHLLDGRRLATDELHRPEIFAAWRKHLSRLQLAALLSVFTVWSRAPCPMMPLGPNMQARCVQ
jgi:hypothetical protein